MNKESFYNFGRRDFIKYSLLAAGALSLPSLHGCAIPRKNVPSLDYRTFLIKNARLVNVISGRVVDNACLLADNGFLVFQKIGEFKNYKGIVFDVKGRYLIPGLIDAHCHSTSSPVFSMRMIDLLNHSRQQKQNFISAIESGVTTIRDLGAFPGLLHMFIRDIKKGNLPGPRVVYCNSILNVMGSHPEIPPSDVNIFAKPASLFIGMIMNNFRNTKEMKECLEENAKGASFIKLTMDNQTLFCKKKKEIPVYTKEQLDTIFQFAEKKGLPVSGHHQFKYGFDRAMEYPFNSIEHIVTDTILSDDDIMKMAKKDIAIVPTMATGQSFLMEEAFDELPDQYRTSEITRELQARKEYFEGDALKHCDPLLHKQNLSALKYYKTIGRDNLWENKKFLVNPDVFFNMIANGYSNLKKMNQAGILIGCGFDAGMPFCYFGGNYREYEILQRVGFSNIDILRCATINNAKILRMEYKIGSLETGKYADMVVLDKNPLEDIRALRNPQMVFKQGDLMFSSGNLQQDGTIQSLS
ncbi:MAG: amidohydrolase family protein [Syntrophaceae bacterium]|nr:amidohydrolase family protein [Syntrophaceae bacterium]